MKEKTLLWITLALTFLIFAMETLAFLEHKKVKISLPNFSKKKTAAEDGKAGASLTTAQNQK